MKLLCLVICICVLQATLVESGLIFDKLSAGVSKVTQDIKCGIHKTRNVFSHHDHEKDPCDLSGPTNNKVDDSKL